MHHLGIGRTHARAHVVLLVQDLDVRIVNAVTGELLREFTIDPTKDYHPTGAPKAPPENDKARTYQSWVRAVADLLRDHSGAACRNRTDDLFITSVGGP